MTINTLTGNVYVKQLLCGRDLLLVNDYYCIWSSIMQKLKNILGSRKKGAQEPHAAREPRNGYQGNTTSNLKGISLERLTLPAGITRYCLCPLFFLFSTTEHLCLTTLNVCVVLVVSPQRARS